MFTTTEPALGGFVAPDPTTVSAHELRSLLTREVTTQAAFREPVPCAARPSTGFVHREGQCRCFVGGPAPEFTPPKQARLSFAS